MASTADHLPTGLAELRYPITQVSLVVEDIDQLLERYHQSFGWAPWQDFDHVPPVHHAARYQGRPVDYSLRGAEVYVGDHLNFELLKPLPGGDSLFHDQLSQRGQGIVSIASMFHERADGDAVKAAFSAEFGLEVICRAQIGDHIEYYYVDTQRDFGCPIESGSGHAIDFVGPARVYPHPGAKPGPSPLSGMTYAISQVTLVARDLATKVNNYRKAFGWGPWRVFDARTAPVESCRFDGADVSFDARIAQTLAGELNFEIVEPLGGPSPWQEFLDRNGEGLMGVTLDVASPSSARDAVEWFASIGVGTRASARVAGADWFLLDSHDQFKTYIAVSDRLAHDAGELTFTTL